MNRRHMTGDHHGQTAGRATLLARAMDEILGTHKSLRVTPRSSTTRSAFVHAQLREDVLRGVLPPGQRLRLVELAERFSVSQSVVREALTRLAEQGLAVAVPRQEAAARAWTG